MEFAADERKGDGEPAPAVGEAAAEQKKIKEGRQLKRQLKRELRQLKRQLKRERLLQRERQLKRELKSSCWEILLMEEALKAEILLGGSMEEALLKEKAKLKRLEAKLERIKGWWKAELKRLEAELERSKGIDKATAAQSA